MDKEKIEAKMNALIEKCAEICHNSNVAYSALIGEKPMKSWSNTSDDQKRSIMEGVMKVLSNDTITPEVLHNEWMRSKINDGWQYGSVKDVEKKTHPALVAYDKLPAETKIRDYLFISIVNGFFTT